jgi:quercetin dioxygenase-like cupin family protein
MPNDTKIICVGPGEGDAFSAVGDVYRVLAAGRQTGDVYALSEIRVSPNNGPPPHIHSREDESFFVLEGEVEFQVGNETIVRKRGNAAQLVPPCFQVSGAAEAIGGRALCQFVLCS